MLTIKEKLEEITSEYTDMPTQEFYQASSFADLNIDSLAIVEIIFDIEEAFDIKIPAESELESEGYTFDSFVGVLNIVTELVEKESSHD
jgi:acyl carrier protein